MMENNLARGEHNKNLGKNKYGVKFTIIYCFRLRLFPIRLFTKDIAFLIQHAHKHTHTEIRIYTDKSYNTTASIYSTLNYLFSRGYGMQNVICYKLHTICSICQFLYAFVAFFCLLFFPILLRMYSLCCSCHRLP